MRFPRATRPKRLRAPAAWHVLFGVFLADGVAGCGAGRGASGSSWSGPGGFRRLGGNAGCPADSVKPAADPGGGEPASGQWPFPGVA